MELRQAFTRDVLCDHGLTAIYVFCLTEAQPIPYTVWYDNDFIDLKPYEVLIDFDRIERDMGLSREGVIEKLEFLTRLRRIKSKLCEKHALVEFINIAFPINPVSDKSDPSSGLVAISYREWVDIDLKFVKNNFSAKYLELMGIALKGFVDVVGNKKLPEINKSDYHEYVRTLETGRRISNTSVNNYTRALKASLNRAISAGYLKQHPLKGLRPLPEARGEPIIVEPDEYRAIRETLPHKWQALVCDFALATCLRRNEILNLRKCNIDLAMKTLAVLNSKDFRPKFGKRTNPCVVATGGKSPQICRRISHNKGDRDRPCFHWRRRKTDQ